MGYIIRSVHLPSPAFPAGYTMFLDEQPGLPITRNAVRFDPDRASAKRFATMQEAEYVADQFRGNDVQFIVEPA
jgi:hypothetical protein